MARHIQAHRYPSVPVGRGILATALPAPSVTRASSCASTLNPPLTGLGAAGRRGRPGQCRPHTWRGKIAVARLAEATSKYRAARGCSSATEYTVTTADPWVIAPQFGQLFGGLK